MLEHRTRKIRVLFSQEYKQGNPQQLVNLIFDLYRKYVFNSFIWVDGANRAFVNLLKIAFNESLSWEKFTARPETMKVIPVSFGVEHKQMLSHLAMLVSKNLSLYPKRV